MPTEMSKKQFIQYLRKGLPSYACPISCSYCSCFLDMSQSFAAEKVTYYHYDLLGSPIAAANEKGEVLWCREYSSYGDRLLDRDTMNDNASGYTGHVHDTETGITCMQARYHIPEVGRLMSTDSVGFKNAVLFYGNVYGKNNPYKYTYIKGEFAFLDFL